MTHRLMTLWTTALVAALLTTAALAGTEKARPAAGDATPPTMDFVKDLFDDYAQGAERDRFFQAAGIDGEIDPKEFAAVKGKDDAFARSYDRWDMAIAHDLDKSGKLNWPEAEKYRLAVKAMVLTRYDKDKSGKLNGAERDEANKMLARGLRRPRGRGWSRRRWDRNRDGKVDDEEKKAMEAEGTKWRQRMAEWTQKWDADEDGKLSAEERQAAAKAMRADFEKRMLEKWDANKDGALDDEEKTTMRESYRKQMAERMDKWLVRRHDRDGDGELNETEQAAADAEKQRWAKMREEWKKRAEEVRNKLDTDGDGELSTEEREAAIEKARAEWDKRRKEMDTDGDGQISREERRAYFQKIQEKYDEDGDGKLSPEERRQMIETEMKNFLGSMGANAG